MRVTVHLGADFKFCLLSLLHSPDFSIVYNACTLTLISDYLLLRVASSVGKPFNNGVSRLSSIFEPARLCIISIVRRPSRAESWKHGLCIMTLVDQRTGHE